MLLQKMLFKHQSVLYFNLVFFTFALLFFSNIITLKALTGNNDSISSPFNTEYTFEKQISIIQTMNEYQLNNLVDQLMKKDSIPIELLTAINIAACNVNQKESKNDTLPLFSSTELYEGWSADKLFSEYNNSNKAKTNIKDTTFTLVLNCDEHKDYKHPFNGPITSSYGWRKGTMHKGIDIDLLKGDTVSAAFDGIVRYAKRGGGYGNVVIVRHFNGLETVYAHLSKINVVPDQYVSSGDLIGLGGSTGHSTGAHLHFEVRLKGVAINPKYLISFDEQNLVSDEFIIKKTKSGIAAYTPKSKFYTVAKGDNLYVIAKKLKLKPGAIREMNNLYAKKLYLKPGQQICVGLN
jgi:murein DD-endopeptidase MepM/ murein hydrolase activator NlpD